MDSNSSVIRNIKQAKHQEKGAGKKMGIPVKIEIQEQNNGDKSRESHNENS